MRVNESAPGNLELNRKQEPVVHKDTATGKILRGWSGAHLKADFTVKWQLAVRHGEERLSEGHLWEPELSPL